MKPQRYWPLAVTAAVIALDRATKHLIETRLAPWESCDLLPYHVRLVNARNTGIAFSLFDNGQRASPLLVIFTCAVMAFVAWMLWRNLRARLTPHWGEPLGLALVLGGAAGNLYDRLLQGAVTDFLDCYWGMWHFPAFNVADTAITCGAGVLLLGLWLTREPRL